MSRPGLTYEPPLYAWNLGSVVAENVQRSSVPYDKFQVDVLEGAVEGFSTTSKQSAASAIDALGSIFLFDASNYDGMIHFIPRGLPSIVDITDDDCIDDGGKIVEITRQDAIVVPRVLHLKYYDTDGGLTSDQQTSDRTLDDRARSESSTETTVIMRADDAARSVTISHKIAVEEKRGEVKFKLPTKWIGLACGDVVRFNGDRVRITEIDIEENHQNYTAIYDRASAYESTIQGLPIVQPSVPPSLVVADTLIYFIDSHILSGTDDELGYYMAVTPVNTGWQGAVVDISKDGGINWIDSNGTSSPCVSGVLTAPLATHPVWIPDHHNVAEVQLIRPDMELTDATFEEVLNRFNLAIIGNEIINFETANQVGETDWELSGLLRGRKGSPITTHSVGERFVMLSDAALTFVPAELFELGRSLTFRVTSVGAETESERITVTFAGNSQRERAPAYLRARNTASGVLVQWQGVGRLGGGASVGMGAYFTGYRVKRGASVWNTTDMQITLPAGGGTISVMQVNSITGEGPAISVTL